MLVLSRRSSEDLLFPSLGITIRVLRIASNFVKLGIVAPRDVPVVRGEIASADHLIQAIYNFKSHINSHALRDRLHSLALVLETLSHQQTGSGLPDEISPAELAHDALGDLEDEFVRIAHSAVPEESNLFETRQCRLLVVEDDDNERELLASALRLEGFAVQTANDGITALECLNSGARLPDAILLDMHMRQLHGEATLRCIRTDSQLEHMKVIGISGNKPDLHILPDDVRGLDAWFLKPLKLDQLISFIHRMGFPAVSK